MAADDDERGWVLQLLIVIGMLALVALLIGGIISVFALGAARVTGLDSAQPRATQKPSLYVPSGKPTVGLDEYPKPSGAAASPEAAGSPSESATKRPQKDKPITLRVFPQRVAANERINLTGAYRGGEGARLQVERLEGGRWTDFPVGASVTGGQFTTYVTTGRSGLQRFRVVDPLSDKRSNPVRVTVG